MLSKWRIRECEIAGAAFYEVCRVTDAADPKRRVESYGGLWATEKEAQELAERLNSETGK